jgi:hypothetical protein
MWVRNDGALNNNTSIPRIFSHELVEACTDPEGDAWQINPVNSTNWNEIGDACSSTTVLNGVLVQSYWSQFDHACVIPTVFSLRRILKFAGKQLTGGSLKSLQPPPPPPLIKVSELIRSLL